MSNPHDYNVGWICAIKTEYVAAQAFLDEKHGPPEFVSDKDDNDYTLGRMGKHNVVIAVLPDGEYGISAATSAAKDLLHTFPNVRIGLMVGIGGGAPSPKHDIRLGDIVISAHRNGKGGVIQYDYGKSIQGQPFLPTAVLDQPPKVLRTALNGLQAQYEIEGHRLEDSVDIALNNMRKATQKRYKRPDPSTDRLYRSDIIHPLTESDAGCAETCGDGESKLVPRSIREEDDDNPAIHYGLIASGNQLMKDAKIRDRLSKEHDILCFEMEAAGLMNNFPCLVIRGICDYSDSHKNKEWQAYAAMTAAAYTKDLLGRIHPNKVESEKKMVDVLKNVEQNVKAVTTTIQDSRINAWINAPDPSNNQNEARQQRSEGSGGWFLGGDSFHRWRNTKNSFIWLHGIAGCGKTILSSAIIDHLTKSQDLAPLIYFYFDFSDKNKQNMEEMLRSLIGQLYNKQERCGRVVEKLFAAHDNGYGQPSLDKLCTSFLEMVEQYKEVFIVLDALDESKTRRELVSWMRRILTSEGINVHLLATSRQEEDIASQIRKWAPEHCIAFFQNNHDIETYIRRRVKYDEGLQRWRGHPHVQKEIENALFKKVDGMFRWAACQLDALGRCLTYDLLRNALDRLPSSLSESYSRMLDEIPPEYRSTSLRILQFLAFSPRPLAIQEIIDVIAVDPDGKPHFDPKRRMPNPHEVSLFCPSLVIMAPARDPYNITKTVIEIRLSHYSVKEYLISSQVTDSAIQCFRDSKLVCATIADVCLAYLLHLDFDLPIREIIALFPFARFAAEYCMDFAALGYSDDRILCKLGIELLSSRRPYENWLRMYDPDEPGIDKMKQKHTKFSEVPSEIRPCALYYASMFGLSSIARHLTRQGVDANTPGGKYGSPLQAASFGGHEKVIDILLNSGSRINAKGGRHGSALKAACARGNERVAELLLQNGADVNAEGGQHRFALRAASSHGHSGIVMLLLDWGADAGAQDALHAAAVKEHFDIIKILVDHGVAVDTRSAIPDPQTALYLASQVGNEKSVELLLGMGADVNAIGGFSGTALEIAIYKGHKNVAEILLDKGADTNKGLQTAANLGRQDMVQMLVKKGANVNGPSCALHHACTGGHQEIVWMLLEYGADVNLKGQYFGTALQAASVKGDLAIVQKLLDHGAEVNTQGGHYGNALQAALVGGNEAIVEMLMINGAYFDALGQGYANAFGNKTVE